MDAWVADMATMRVPRTYRTVFLAGPTFNLLPDDTAMAAALASIAAALAVRGTAVVPLFVPEPVGSDEIGIPNVQETPDGSIGWQILSAARDDEARTQTLTLRYERTDHNGRDAVERDWVLHWIDVERFTEMARSAGLAISGVAGEVAADPVDVVLQTV